MATSTPKHDMPKAGKESKDVQKSKSVETSATKEETKDELPKKDGINGDALKVKELSQWLNTVASTIEDTVANKLTSGGIRVLPHNATTGAVQSTTGDDMVSEEPKADPKPEEKETSVPDNDIADTGRIFVPDTARIVPELQAKLEKDSARFAPLFYTQVSVASAKPFTEIPKWSIIESNIKNLLMKDPNDTKNLASTLKDVISTYCKFSDDTCDFGVLSNETISSVFVNILPVIANQALKLPSRLKSISFLREGQNRTLYLTRNLVSSLIANAMLCTISNECNINVLKAEFNFLGLYHKGNDPVAEKVRIEKLKCFLEYFKHIARMPQMECDSIISFERRCKKTHYDWMSSTASLTKVTVTSKGRIENADGFLQVDFANRKIGGGVLRNGCHQDEIRFCISPEMICGMLLAEKLSENEVLVITGTNIFSSYEGFGKNFQFRPLGKDPWVYEPKKDSIGRDLSQVVCMDARNFKPADKMTQYEASKINRDLHKCFVGFFKGYHPTPVATGNWGCGYFNGDPQLKFLIQWMAASVNARPLHYIVNDDKAVDKFEHVRDLLINNNITVNKLYQAVLQYQHIKILNPNATKPSSVFDYLDEVGVLFKKHNSKSPFSQCILC